MKDFLQRIDFIQSPVRTTSFCATYQALLKREEHSKDVLSSHIILPSSLEIDISAIVEDRHATNFLSRAARAGMARERKIPLFAPA